MKLAGNFNPNLGFAELFPVGQPPFAYPQSLGDPRQTFPFLEDVLDHADFELGGVRFESGHPLASSDAMLKAFCGSIEPGAKYFPTKRSGNRKAFFARMEPAETERVGPIGAALPKTV